MLAWRRYKSTLHAACGQPIQRAWHPDNDAAVFDVTVGVCHACTAKEQAAHPGAEPVKVVIAIEDSRDYDAHPLPPLRLEDFD